MPQRIPGPHDRLSRWSSDLAEGAASFGAVAVAGCATWTAGAVSSGEALAVTGVTGVLAAVCRRVWRGRRGGSAPQPPVEAPADEPTVLWRMRTTVKDAPGSLAAVCTALARGRIDIVTLQTHPLAEGTVDEFLLRAPAALSAVELRSAMTEAGGADTWLERADAHELVDMPTRMLAVATRTALEPAELPLALRALFGRCSIRWTPEGEPAPDAAEEDDTVLCLADPAGGTLTARRGQLPFTPTEFARARALVELEARLGRRTGARRETPTGRVGSAGPVALEQDGFTLRRATPEDLAAAVALHARCSAETLDRRYHGPAVDADRYLAHLLSPRFGRSLAVESASGRLVALGHLLWDGGENEVALLVEDAWQRRGVGTALLRGLVELAAEAERESVYAVTRASNTGMVAAMRALGLPLDFQVEDGTLVITAALPARADAAGTLPWRAARRG